MRTWRKTWYGQKKPWIFTFKDCSWVWKLYGFDLDFPIVLLYLTFKTMDSIFFYRRWRPHRPLWSDRPGRRRPRSRITAVQSRCFIGSRICAPMENSATQPNHIFQLHWSPTGVPGLRQSSTLGWVVSRGSTHHAESARDQNGDAQRIPRFSGLRVRWLRSF